MEDSNSLKAFIDWKDVKISIQVQDDPDFEMVIEAVRAVLIGLGYHPDSVKEFIPEID